MKSDVKINRTPIINNKIRKFIILLLFSSLTSEAKTHFLSININRSELEINIIMSIKIKIMKEIKMLASKGACKNSIIFIETNGNLNIK